MKSVTLREIFKALAEQYSDVDNFGLMVKNDVVWDFKDQNGELRLIHEPGLGDSDDDIVRTSEVNFEEYLDLPVVSEETGLGFENVELVDYGNHIICIRFS